ncbi:pentapeptide repeat-containing protein [Actinomycetospora sp. CA-101289]|uniref:pentapeptide repeat-containing protein n=1 Tax=Actinomycetospora sp. CA-101289 TaxID=3239893 RepID=UPI003D965F30
MLLIAAFIMSRRRPDPQITPISTWALVLVVLVILTVGGGVTIWLYGIASTTPPPGQPADAAVRIDAIRTGLTIAVGTGGAFGLVLAFRRQQSGEITGRNQIVDTTERRITELYTKAVDQLGAAEAPVRLGGLYALERLAQNTPDQRQTIVDVICAYLRMPYPSASASGQNPFFPEGRGKAAPDHTAQQERQVRLTAQNILHRHLRPCDTARFWRGLDIDLTGAHLISFDLDSCQVRDARFDGATFTGRAFFNGTTFSGGATFFGATVDGGAFFEGATFSGGATFRGATFSGGGYFTEATFSGSAPFNRVFTGGPFDSGVSFYRATFSGSAFFNGATFNADTDFRLANFGDASQNHASFMKATFNRDGFFNGATFSDASFEEATFSRGVSLRAARAEPRGQQWPPGWALDAAVEPDAEGRLPLVQVSK